MSGLTDSETHKTHPQISRFSSPYGDEVYVTMEPQPGQNAGDDFHALLNQYSDFLSLNGLNDATEIYVRFYLSNISSEAPILRRLLNKRKAESFYSLIGQPPASGGRISLEAYHITSLPQASKIKSSEEELLIHHGAYSSLWLKRVSQNSQPPGEQTTKLFADISDRLGLRKARIKENVIRTWCYINDIYKNYDGFVKARMEYFNSIGMTDATHTIASTGIEASHERGDNIIGIDALSLMGLEPAQVEYLSALDYMPSTHTYGVSFERGTKVSYGDRAHYYVSGTASIDKDGTVLHEDNLVKQASRALENIRSLLTPHGADISDMKTMTIYLRDDMPYDDINRFLANELPDTIPRVIVRGNVCREAWLIEIEGIAITENRMETYAPFC